MASSVPRIHDTRATAVGRAPLSAASVGLSTTARMAVPVRLPNSRTRRPTAMADRERRSGSTLSHVIVAPPIVTVRWPNRNDEVVGLGGLEQRTGRRRCTAR